VVPPSPAHNQAVWSEDSASAATPAPLPASDPLTETEGLDLVGILSSIAETAYVWHFSSDSIEWESNAAEILEVESPEQISSATKFHQFLTAEDAKRRFDAVRCEADGSLERGVPYRLQYDYHPKGLHRQPRLVVEDQGRWWPDKSGKPACARGVVRILQGGRSGLNNGGQPVSGLDPLTGTLSRARLTTAIANSLSCAVQTQNSSSFLIVSINNLGVINETFGFEVGDQVICAVGQRLQQKLRAGDVIGRYASNRLGIVLQGCGLGAMRIAAERFLRAVRDTTIPTVAGHLAVTASIGGVVMPDQAHTEEQAIEYALRARDRARTKRFDCFISHEANGEQERTKSRSRSVADDVLAALDEQRMRLVLQPMVHASTGKAELYECLLRMERPDGTIVSAGEFIAIAEQLGLSRLIDRRTLELAVALLKKHSDLNLSVNVSGLTCTDHEWLMTLQRLTGRRRDLLSRMVIEITETAAIEDLDQSINFVDTLKELGARVAIDDFGAGYTSFKNLRMMNVDMVKIDGVFIKNVVNDTSDQIFVKTMIHLARTLGMQTVAEWVGDAACEAYLKDAGIDYLQGFHYGMPFDASRYPQA
jgi:diguanylate cyclase (GGDEF)-like protein